MKRREFIKVTAASGPAVAMTGLAGCTADQAGPSDATHSVPAFELDEVTIADLGARMASGDETARSITQKYLGRIEEIDRNGPTINSVIELNSDALDIADRLDRERRDGQVRGPMHGIPILIKDNIDTADKMMTTAGSLALAGHIPTGDSFVAQKLREAGAIILGKTNLSEWANFRSTRSSSGWSGRGGQTRNPYALDRNPCGSSSGSGAAAAANLCAAAIGTETNGSVVCPSSANGLVGIKPTVGLVSRSGIIPIAHTQDTAGPMARTVADAAALLSALVGVDPRDEATPASVGNSHTDYTQFLNIDDLEGIRIGVARNYFGFHDRVDKIMEEAIAALMARGATLIDPAEIATRGQYGSASFDVLLYEFKTDLNKYLATVDPDVPVHSLEELIAFNEANSTTEMPYFGQEILIRAQEKGDLSSPEYLEALEKCRRLSRDEGIDATLNQHQLDAILAPTGGPAWVTDWVNGDHFSGGSSSPAARSGYANITVPAGMVHGLPVGISFFAGAYAEPTLLRIAHAFEQETKQRQKPGFLPHADFGNLTI